MKKFIFVLLILSAACANPKDIELNGQVRTFEPYGWMNEEEYKNDSIYYKVNTGNVVWSLIGVETVIIPVLLTGNSLYEPVRVKEKYKHAKNNK